MAEGGVKQGALEPTGPDRLRVDYKFSGQYVSCMTIPLNLASPTMRALKYKFNFGGCAAMEKPNGLIYRKGFYFTMEQWFVHSSIITLEPDPEP